MDHAKRAQLISVLTHAIKDAGTRKQFEEHYCFHVAACGVETLTTGPNVDQFFNAVHSSYDAVARKLIDAGRESEANSLWNPTTAALLKFIKDGASQRLRENKLPEAKKIPSKQQPQTSKSVKPSTPKKTSATTPLSGNSSVKLDHQEDEQVTILPHTQVRTALITHAQHHEVPLFHSFPWIKKDCNKLDCTFCRDVYLETQVTKCFGRDFYPCSETGTLCHPMAYYPHVGLKRWKKCWKHHKSAERLIVKHPQLPSLNHWTLNIPQSTVEQSQDDLEQMTAMSSTSSTRNIQLGLSTLVLERRGAGNTNGTGANGVVNSATPKSRDATSSALESQPSRQSTSSWGDESQEYWDSFVLTSAQGVATSSDSRKRTGDSKMEDEPFIEVKRSTRSATRRSSKQ